MQSRCSRDAARYSQLGGGSSSSSKKGSRRKLRSLQDTALLKARTLGQLDHFALDSAQSERPGAASNPMSPSHFVSRLHVAQALRDAGHRLGDVVSRSPERGESVWCACVVCICGRHLGHGRVWRRASRIRRVCDSRCAPPRVTLWHLVRFEQLRACAVEWSRCECVEWSR